MNEYYTSHILDPEESVLCRQMKMEGDKHSY